MLQSLINACVRRRVAALVVTACIAAYGVHAYLDTPVEAYPDVTNLQITVISQMPGLAPPEVERQLTVPIERVLNGTPGLTRMRSESQFGLSLVYLTFEDGADTFRSRMLVSERLGQAELPDGVTPGLGPDATPLGQVFMYRLTSDRHSLAELRAAQEWTVERVLRQVPGVADVVGRGGFLKEIHVHVDPGRLQAHGLTLSDVREALERANQNVGGGFQRLGEQQLVIRGVGTFASPQDIKDVVLRAADGTPLTISQIGRVVVSHTPRQGTTGYDLDAESVEGTVFLRRGENPSVVLAGVHEKVRELNERILPAGMQLEPFYDRTLLVGETLKTVHRNLAEGALLVVAIVWLFIRSWRGSLLVASVIPLSLLTAFIGLHAIGLPANLISMGAIDFGIIVDGALILVENVMHRWQTGPPRDRRQALALVAEAARDVARPTAFAMAIIIAALIPVFTLESVEGRIFRPLALTYSFALAGALVFALTTVPALCAVVLRAGRSNGKRRQVVEPRFVTWLREAYGRLLERLLARRALVICCAFALLGAGALAGSRLGTEFLPELDEGDIVVFVEMPSSIALERGQEVLYEVRRRLLVFPEVRQVGSQQGRPEDGTDNESVNMSETTIRLHPRESWRPGWSKERLIDAMRATLTEIPGVRYNFSQPIQDNVEEAISGVRGKVVLKIFGDDLTVMRETLQAALAVLQPIAGVVDLSLYRDRAVPQLEITVDRAALARNGIAVETVNDVIETALAGRVATNYWEEGRPVPVRLRLPQPDREDLDRIGELQISSPDGARLPLRQLASIAVSPGRASIYREDNSRAMALKFNVEGRDVGSVIREAMQAVGREVKVPDNYYLVWGGEFENQQRAVRRLAIIVPVSLLVVLGLLYTALGCGRGALCVLLSVPFAITGGVFALLLAEIHLSVSACIGFIALLGQVALAALLVLGAVQDQRRAGLELGAAIVAGAKARLRAVLMAGLLAAVGLLPMALSRGMGSETQRPFATVLVGGMVTVMLFTLLALPVLYTLLAPRRLRRPEEDS